MLNTLRPFARGHGAKLIVACLAAAFAGLLELLPQCLIYLAALDLFADAPTTARLPMYALAALAALVLRFAFLGGSLIATHAVAFDVLRKVRIALAARLGEATEVARSARTPGDLKKVLVDDVDQLEGLLAHNLPDLVAGIVVPLSAVIALAAVDLRLALTSVALIPLAMVFAWGFTRNMETQFAQWHGAEARANSALIDYLRGIPVLKAFGADASSLARVRTSVESLGTLAAAMTRKTIWGFSAFQAALQNNLVVVLPVGLALHAAGELGAAELVFFVALGFGVTAPLLKLMFIFGNVQHYEARTKRIDALLALPVDRPTEAPDAAAAAAPSRGPLGLRVEGLSFAYDEARGDVLTDVGFEAKAGEVTAIVGPSGCGKSTLLSLMAGVHLPSCGSVSWIDDEGSTNVADLRRDAREQGMTFLQQRAWLMRGTLRENLLLGCPPDLDERVLARAVSAAQLEPLVARVGLEGLVGEAGATLSGGQAQLVTIGRAIVRDRPLLLLDEVTAHLDPLLERSVQRALAAIGKGRTVVVVAHRLRSIQEANAIVVLDEGRVVDRGTHDELLNR
ncbi:MAG: ABC transporter ATP-binding protein, partial [Myxococcota bacterium]